MRRVSGYTVTLTEDECALWLRWLPLETARRAPAEIFDFVNGANDFLIERAQERMRGSGRGSGAVPDPEVGAEWLTTTQVAGLLGVSREWVGRLAATETATPIARGPDGRWRIPLGVVECWRARGVGSEQV